MLQPDQRLTLGPLQNPVRGFLHGSAAGVSLALAHYFWTLPACEPAARATLLIFAFSQAGLFAASSLYHSAPWKPTWKSRMQRVDHSMIYVKIAGSMTPIVWIGLHDWGRWAILIAAWSIAAIGIAQKVLLPQVHEKASVAIQILQASLVVPALVPFSQRFPGAAVALILTSGVFYAAGVIIYLSERPRLWPRIFSFHEVFHVLTLGASASQYALALQYLTRVP